MERETKLRLYTGLGVFLAAFVVYLRTMAATTSFWDCGEFITASYILGIPHPPGYPIFCLIGRVMTMLFPMITEVAVRINLLSPIFSAITVALTYLLTVKIITIWRGQPKDKAEELLLHLAGVVGACFLAFAPSWWDNSIEAEVYGMAMFMMSLTVWLALRWRDQIGQVGNRKMLLLIAFMFGMGWVSHQATLLVGPALLLFILVTDWRALADWKFLATAVVLSFLPLTVNAYLIIRANLNPNLDMCSPKTWDSLMYVLERKQYEPFNFFERREPFMYQFWKMCLRYFTWQFLPIVDHVKVTVPRLLISLGTAVGVIGMGSHLAEGEEKKFGITAAVLLVGGVLVALFSDSPLATVMIALGVVAGFFHVFRRKDPTFAIVGPAFIITTLGLVTYLNMADPQPRDRDYVYAPAYEFFAIWIGLGAWRLMTLLRQRLAARSAGQEAGGRLAARAAVGLGVVLAVCGLLNIKEYFFEKNRSRNWIPHDYGYNILASAEPGGIIFTNGDNDTYPVWFQQETKHFRQDVRIVNLSLANVDWYLKQMKRRGVPMDISDYQISQLMPVRIADGSVLKTSDLAIRVILASNAGKQLTLERLLAPPDSFAQWLFAAGYKEKYPVYFAVTVSDDNFVGLQSRLSFEGMLYRVEAQATNKTVNIGVTEHNLDAVYRFTGITDPSLYKDDNTQRITLGNYVVAFWQLGMSLRQQANATKDPAQRRQLLQQALKEFSMAQQIMPEESAGNHWLGVVNAELGDYPAALGYFRKVATKEHDNAYAVAQLGATFQQAGQYDSAEAYYKAILLREPGSKVAYERLYDLYANAEKDRARAIGVIQEWLRYNPGDPNATKILSDLTRRK
ncbi:MAG TPA: DUF2723 domain-containing protein [Candidatus Edwardsbacteria bacterium]|nr:DUF2723 domain-containing protein [Candidatus Edwardsbacteria bacterium]